MSERRDKEERRGLIPSIWRSIFRRPVVPATDRERRWVVFNTLVLHLRPTRVPAATLRYTHTFGLGGMSLVLVLLLAATGILMMLVYEPSPEGAYASVQRLESDYLFGALVRGVHHWCANLLIVVALLHLLRVFFTGGFLGPRQFNWVVGLTLLLLILVSNFTGYLLPWDQLSYWAVTICTAMVAYVPALGGWLQQVIRGGEEIGSATLINFYTVHTTVVPVLLLFLAALHFWRVRKAGGVVTPRAEGEVLESPPERVLFLPHLLLREMSAALVLAALVLVLAMIWPAPLGPPANPGMSPNPAKAPWYFLGFQELQLHFHAAFAVFVIPLAAALALALLPYLRYDTDQTGTWFRSAKGRRMAVAAGGTGLVLTVIWVILDERVGTLPGAGSLPPWVGNGLLPFALLLGLILAFSLLMKKAYRASRHEAVQAVFVLLLVSFAVLTATGIWLRGAGMALVWPWSA
jgi:quinol-cytochrome oxidoreductase complex cytochrome b subunit